MLEIENDLCDLKEKQKSLNMQWKEERDSINKLSEIKEDIEKVQLQIEQAKRDYDLNKAAELEYGTLNNLQTKLKFLEKVKLKQKLTLM